MALQALQLQSNGMPDATTTEPPLKGVREALASTLSADKVTRTEATRTLDGLAATPKFATTLLALATAAPPSSLCGAGGAGADAHAAGARAAQQAAAVYLKNFVKKNWAKAAKASSSSSSAAAGAPLGEAAEREALRRALLGAVLVHGARGRALCDALHAVAGSDVPDDRWAELPAELGALLARLSAASAAAADGDAAAPDENAAAGAAAGETKAGGAPTLDGALQARRGESRSAETADVRDHNHPSTVKQRTFGTTTTPSP